MMYPQMIKEACSICWQPLE